MSRVEPLKIEDLPEDQLGHQWFGAVCLRCGTTFDRVEAKQTCHEAAPGVRADKEPK